MAKEADGGIGSILVVEDDADTAYSFALLLEGSGYRVEIANTAATALATLRRADIDAVLCDLGLPGEMSGLELAKAMQHDPDLKHIPLVAITGYGQQHDREQTASAGFVAHLVKPVEFPVLQETLRRLSPRRPRPPKPTAGSASPHRARAK